MNIVIKYLFIYLNLNIIKDLFIYLNIIIKDGRIDMVYETEWSNSESRIVETDSFKKKFKNEISRKRNEVISIALSTRFLFKNNTFAIIFLVVERPLKHLGVFIFK